EPLPDRTHRSPIHGTTSRSGRARVFRALRAIARGRRPATQRRPLPPPGSEGTAAFQRAAYHLCWSFCARAANPIPYLWLGFCSHSHSLIPKRNCAKAVRACGAQSLLLEGGKRPLWPKKTGNHDTHVGSVDDDRETCDGGVRRRRCTIRLQSNGGGATSVVGHRQHTVRGRRRHPIS